MAKKEKSFLGKLLGAIFGLVFTVALVVGLGCAFLYFKYNINIFNTLKQVKTLNEITQEKIVTNPYGEEDMQFAMTVSNNSIDGLITYSSEEGYTISADTVTETLQADLKLTDKQIGAIANNMLNSQESLNINLNGIINLKEYGFQIVQVKFENIYNNNADINVVVKIDLAKVKEKMTKFPLNLIANKMTNTLYISATSRITKGETPFAYTVEAKSLMLNNLDSEQTADIFKTVNNFVKIGKTTDFSKTICELVANGLIGTEENKGLALALQSANATDYAFETISEQNYFVIQK